MTISDDELARLEALGARDGLSPASAAKLVAEVRRQRVQRDLDIACYDEAKRERDAERHKIELLEAQRLEHVAELDRLQAENERLRAEAITLRNQVFRLDTENERLRAACNGSCDIALARCQVGPDAVVPGNARECAELWEQEASRLRAEAAELRASLEDAAARMGRMELLCEAARSWRRTIGAVGPLTDAINAYEASLPGIVEVGP